MKHKRARAHLLVGFSATINRSSLRLSRARETAAGAGDAAIIPYARGLVASFGERRAVYRTPLTDRPTDRPTDCHPPTTTHAQLTVGNLLLDQTVYINHAVGTAVGCPGRAQGWRGWRWGCVTVPYIIILYIYIYT